MNLDENQRNKLAQWIEEGRKLSEIQNLLTSELGLKLTYMEVRFLVDDLNLTLKETEPAEPENKSKADPTAKPEDDEEFLPGGAADASGGPPGRGVSVSVDRITKPGALVSGNVTFSDGNTADWYLDQAGRLGLAPKMAGYRPSAEDVQKFQVALEREISKAGL